MGKIRHLSISNFNIVDMKRFLLKFLMFFCLFHTTTAFFHFYVAPNCSGDIGTLGQIPFGSEYDGLDVASFKRSGIADANVVNIEQPEMLASYHVITIGDSFSQMGEMGYQWKLSSLLHDTIANFTLGKDNPFHCAARLINSNMITPGQVLIVESVERSIVPRFTLMDTLSVWDPAPPQVSSSSTDAAGPKFLEKYLSWIRLSLGYDNPIHAFDLSQDCFINPKCPDRLYVYSGDIDGDLLYKIYSEQNYTFAVDKAMQFKDFAESRGIKVFFLIATDKYDAYDPFIADEHDENPTLAYFKGIEGLYDPKNDIQNAIVNGTLEIYKHNNTHWSVVGADLVAERFAAYICLHEKDMKNR